MSDTTKSPSVTIDIGSPNQNNNIIEQKDKVKLSWNDQTETLLRSWGDISSCYNWMHDKSFRKYQKKNFKFSLPVIILSTLTGTLNLALQGYVPAQYMTYAQAGIGGVNIFTGILTTLQNYFRYAENSESHRNASVGWGKLQRNISIELTYDRLSRKDADSFIKVCRMEYDRLLEQSPIILTEIINLFKKKYSEQRKNKKEKKKPMSNLKSSTRGDDSIIDIDDDDDNDDDKLILPDVCGELTHTGVYKESLNECTRLDRLLDVKENEESKLIPEIKDVLLDRLNMLEQRLSIAQTPRAELKSLSEYSAEELEIALERKNTTYRTKALSIDSEQAIQKAIQKHIDPINLNIRRMSDQLQKPVISRVNTSYMADIAINQNKDRDFSFKDLMNKFQKDRVTGINIDKKEEIIQETKEKTKEIGENKNIDKIILQENNLQEIKNTNNVINKNQNINDVIVDINTTLENSDKVLNVGFNKIQNINNIITDVNTTVENSDKVLNDGFNKVKNSISTKSIDNVIEKIDVDKSIVDEVKTKNIEIVSKDLNVGLKNLTNEIELVILENSNKESKQVTELASVVENIILPQNIDISIKPKPKKNHVEINKGNVIGKNQYKLNSFFQTDNIKVEDEKEESIIIQEDSTSNETSTFELSVNENGEESIKLNFVDTDDEEDKK
jgi:hypothetical protein